MTDSTVREALELAAKANCGFQAIPREVSEAAQKALAALEAKPAASEDATNSSWGAPCYGFYCGCKGCQAAGAKRCKNASQDVEEAVAKAAADYAETLPGSSRDAYLIRSHRVGFAKVAIAAYHNFMAGGGAEKLSNDLLSPPTEQPVALSGGEQFYPKEAQAYHKWVKNAGDNPMIMANVGFETYLAGWQAATKRESGKPGTHTGNIKVTPDATIQPTGIIHGEGRIGDDEP